MNGVSRFLKPAALLGLLAALGLAGYGAGKVGATCYTGCEANWGLAYDTHYSVTIQNTGPLPITWDFDGAANPTPLCTGGTNNMTRAYENGGSGQCSAGPSRYKKSSGSFSSDGNITVNGCVTCS